MGGRYLLSSAYLALGNVLSAQLLMEKAVEAYRAAATALVSHIIL